MLKSLSYIYIQGIVMRRSILLFGQTLNTISTPKIASEILDYLLDYQFFLFTTYKVIFVSG